MGLFTRFRYPALDLWQPDGNGAQMWPAGVTGDGSCAGRHAYSVRFTLASAEPASVTAWFYPVHGPSGSYAVGWRWQYEFDLGPGSPAWRCGGWDSHPELYQDLADAERAAHGLAVALAETRSSEHIAATFAFLMWDGVPW